LLQHDFCQKGTAALGHPYGPNDGRGIDKSMDGGRSFQKVLYKDENTGGNDVDIDPANPQKQDPRVTTPRSP
jgi:hypothetical protein